MLLRDILQGVWRCRGLDKSQRIRFLINDEVAGIIRQKLNLPSDHMIQLDTILKFTIANQAEQQGLDNYKGFREELLTIYHNKFFEKRYYKRKIYIQKHACKLSAFLNQPAEKSAFYSCKELYGNLLAQTKCNCFGSR